MHTADKASSRETHRAARIHSKQRTHSWFKKYGQRLAAESSDVTKNASLSAATSKLLGSDAYLHRMLQKYSGGRRGCCKNIVGEGVGDVTKIQRGRERMLHICSGGRKR